MTPEPERIWVDIDDAEHTRGAMIGRVFATDIGDTEYIRLDAHEATVAAARAEGMDHIAAIERLAIRASIASCTCLTKTPDITFHSANCRYVHLQYIIAQCEDFRAAAEASK